MNSDNFLQLLHTGFRATLGATASLVETLQDPIKREQNLSQLRSNMSEQFQEWAEKGEVTEQEARNFVDTVLRQQNSQSSTTTTTAPRDTSPTPVTPPVEPEAQLELQQLTAQIAAIRAELEKLRNPDSNL